MAPNFSQMVVCKKKKQINKDPDFSLNDRTQRKYL